MLSATEQELLTKFEDLALRSYPPKNVLQRAAEGGHANLISYLLSHSSALGNLGVLHSAAKAGHEDIVAQLLAHSPHLIDELDSNRSTPLHLAAKAGHDKVVALLLLHKPSLVDVKDGKGTALHEAAEAGHEGIVARLLAVKSELVDEVRRFELETSLHLAAKNGHDGRTALVKLLYIWQLKQGSARLLQGCLLTDPSS